MAELQEKSELEKAQELIKAEKKERVNRFNEKLELLMKEENCEIVPKIICFGDQYNYEIIAIAK